MAALATVLDSCCCRQQTKRKTAASGERTKNRTMSSRGFVFFLGLSCPFFNLGFPRCQANGRIIANSYVQRLRTGSVYENPSAGYSAELHFFSWAPPHKAQDTSSKEFSPNSYSRKTGQENNNSINVSNNTSPPPKWKAVYITFVLIIMCLLLLSNKVKMDFSMVICLALCLASKIITPAEALAGFSNNGLITALVLLIIPAAVVHTGALDWHMTNFLRRPSSVTDAQLRVCIPFTFLSAFLNGSVISKAMLPIVQQCSKDSGIPLSQLLLPMSYAFLLGGTCTLIGSTTNLVVLGILSTEPQPKTPSIFLLGAYGIPLTLIGLAYIILFSHWLLPGGARNCQEGTNTTSSSTNEQEAASAEDRLLLGARLLHQSFAAGRTVKQSGLCDNGGGIFLVSVYRCATGNIHRAVGNDYLLEVGDVLYFTAFPEEFAQFCEDHGLEMLTSEAERKMFHLDPERGTASSDISALSEREGDELAASRWSIHHTIGCTKESLMYATASVRMRFIYKMLDLIHGFVASSPCGDEVEPLVSESLLTINLLSNENDPPQIIVHVDDDLAIIGVNCTDRSGVLQDISECITRLNLQCRRTEAIVFCLRSISVWRCELLNKGGVDAEEIWEAVRDLLTIGSGSETTDDNRWSGASIVRARVTQESSLVGKTASGVSFNVKYNADILAIQRKGKNVTAHLSKTPFEVGDILILTAFKDSCLMEQIPHSFSPHPSNSSEGDPLRSELSPFSKLRQIIAQANAEREAIRSPIERPHDHCGVADTVIENCAERDKSGDDLHVISIEAVKKKQNKRDFLTAMTVPSSSVIAKKTASQAGLTSIRGVVLVAIERPLLNADLKLVKASARYRFVKTGSSVDLEVEPVSFDDNLAVGDILWFAGTARSIGDLRKIPGLVSYESDEVYKLKERPHDRRLVQAVIGKNSCLVGKTPTDVKFRTRYGAAVIAINRGGRRLHQHPGKVQLRAGDVLLLEAGSSFMKNNTGNDNSFTLLSEVKNSAPPRLRMLIPTLALTVTMIVIDAIFVKALFISSFLAAALLVVFGVISLQEARGAMNWSAYMTVASGIGVGKAMLNAGISGLVADFALYFKNLIGIDYAGVYGCLYIITVIASYLVSSNVAVGLMYPIAAQAAQKSGADIVLMEYCVMFACASYYMMPFDYTENSMVFGLGGYQLVDYLKFGAPLQLILWIATTVVLSLSIEWWWSWVVTAGFFILAALFMETLNCYLRRSRTK